MINFVKQSVEYLGQAPATEVEAIKLIEIAGRTAYKSEDKITNESALKFVSMLKNNGHLSALEHSNITLKIKSGFPVDRLYAILKERSFYHPILSAHDGFYIAGNIRAWIDTLNMLVIKSDNDSLYLFEVFNSALAIHYPNLFSLGIQGSTTIVTPELQLELLKNVFYDAPVFVFKIVTDRGITHEIVRHRVLSFTQESTRYVNYNNKGFTLIDPEEYDSEEIKGTLNHAITEYQLMCDIGYKPQIARDVLPNLLKAEIIVSGRWSGFEHFINLRDAAGAHPRIRKIAQDIRAVFESIGLYTKPAK
jgi:thymidylate synthase (FAD)